MSDYNAFRDDFVSMTLALRDFFDEHGLPVEGLCVQVPRDALMAMKSMLPRDWTANRVEGDPRTFCLYGVTFALLSSPPAAQPEHEQADRIGHGRE